MSDEVDLDIEEKRIAQEAIELQTFQEFKGLLDRVVGLPGRIGVSGRRKPAIYERLKTSHPEKEGVFRVGSSVLNTGGDPAWRTSSRWRIFKRS